jgi:hypothetical protein
VSDSVRAFHLGGFHAVTNTEHGHILSGRGSAVVAGADRLGDGGHTDRDIRVHGNEGADPDRAIVLGYGLQRERGDDAHRLVMIRQRPGTTRAAIASPASAAPVTSRSPRRATIR